MKNALPPKRSSYFITLLEHLSPKKRYALCFALGALAVFGLPPFFYIFVLPISFSGLFILTLLSKNTKQAFATGWFFGLGFFAFGLYWFVHALLVDAHAFGWMVPFAVVFVNSYFALFPALAALGLWLLRDKPLLPLVFAFAAIWLGSELLRSVLFTGFPWNMMGYALGFNLELVQNVSWMMVYGASFLVVVISLAPALFIYSHAHRWSIVALWSVVLVALYMAGSARITSYDTQLAAQNAHGTSLRVVQANIEQKLKADHNHHYAALSTHLAMSYDDETNADTKADIVIWPETAFPYSFNESGEWQAFLRQYIPANTHLITGAMRAESEQGRVKRMWNSLFVLDAMGDVVATHDKHHLVPFGEFIPLRSILPVEKITGGYLDFSEGEGIAPITTQNIPRFLPLICYEVIFPASVRKYVGDATWLLNITNDGWFGDSIGPYQHKEMARFRAIENGLPMVRAANTGVSVVYDAVGREVASLALNAEGVIDFALPPAYK